MRIFGAKSRAEKNWTLTPNAFRRLLDWLDENTDSGGQRYLEMRRLVAYFDRKNCLTSEELADETLNRVARRLEEEGGAIESETPAKFCYIVARFVFLESLREKDKTLSSSVPLDDVLLERPLAQNGQFAATDFGEEKESKEKMLECLERCANKLEPENRAIIFRYYFGEERVKIENRRSLAEELKITMNALSIRACRIRDKLEACIRKCIG